MPSYYIVLEKQIPGVDVFVNGNHLSKHGAGLEKLAKKLGVTTLMNFFSTTKDELASLLGENASTENIPISEEKWFTPEDGLRTINALLEHLPGSGIFDTDRIESELREFARVLEIAKASDVRWHLAIDY